MTISIRNYPTVYCICECEIKPKSLHRNAHKSEITFLFVPLNKRKDKKKVNKLYHKFVTDKNKRKIYSSLCDLLFVTRYCKWKIIRQSISQSFLCFFFIVAEWNDISFMTTHFTIYKWFLAADHMFDIYFFYSSEGIREIVHRSIAENTIFHLEEEKKK